MRDLDKSARNPPGQPAAGGESYDPSPAPPCDLCAGTGEVVTELSPGVRTVAVCSCAKEVSNGE